jgi:hypothetical protein
VDASRRLWPRADLRVGDSDRKAVVDELQRHYIEGRLTSEELGERVSHALGARTFGDLADLLTDLPTLQDPSPAEVTHPEFESYDQAHWQSSQFSGPPIGMIVMLIGIIVMVMVFAVGTRGIPLFFPWPLLIWGFFFMGRPHRGGRRRF